MRKNLFLFVFLTVVILNGCSRVLFYEISGRIPNHEKICKAVAYQGRRAIPCDMTEFTVGNGGEFLLRFAAINRYASKVIISCCDRSYEMIIEQTSRDSATAFIPESNIRIPFVKQTRTILGERVNALVASGLVFE